MNADQNPHTKRHRWKCFIEADLMAHRELAALWRAYGGTDEEWRRREAELIAESAAAPMPGYP